jgi:hypothetical protein
MAIRPSPASRPAAPPTAHRRADASAGASGLCTVVFTVEIAIRECVLARLAVGRVPVVRVTRDDVDIVVPDSGCLEVTNRLSGVGIVVVKS